MWPTHLTLFVIVVLIQDGISCEGLAHSTCVHDQKSSFISLLWNNLNSDQIENCHKLHVSRLLLVGRMCFHWKVLWKEKITSQWWKIRLFWRARVTFAVWSAQFLISPLQVTENKFPFSLEYRLNQYVNWHTWTARAECVKAHKRNEMKPCSSQDVTWVENLTRSKGRGPDTIASYSLLWFYCFPLNRLFFPSKPHDTWNPTLKCSYSLQSSHRKLVLGLF